MLKNFSGSAKCRVLTWKDGFYNGEVKTRKIGSSTMELTAEQLLLQRSEQLRELYSSLLSGECADQQRRRPATALSPEDLGNMEWFYMVCMTYAFRPGQWYTSLIYSIISKWYISFGLENFLISEWCHTDGG